MGQRGEVVDARWGGWSVGGGGKGRRAGRGSGAGTPGEGGGAHLLAGSGTRMSVRRSLHSLDTRTCGGNSYSTRKIRCSALHPSQSAAARRPGARPIKRHIIDSDTLTNIDSPRIQRSRVASSEVNHHGSASDQQPPGSQEAALRYYSVLPARCRQSAGAEYQARTRGKLFIITQDTTTARAGPVRCWYENCLARRSSSHLARYWPCRRGRRWQLAAVPPAFGWGSPKGVGDAHSAEVWNQSVSGDNRGDPVSCESI